MGDRRDPVDEVYRPAYHQITNDENLTEQERHAAIDVLTTDWKKAADAAMAEAERRAPDIVAKALAAVKGAAGGEEYKAYSSAFDSLRDDPGLTHVEALAGLNLLTEKHEEDGVIPKTKKAESAPPNETLDQMRARVFAMKPEGR